jgi:hypothetical protein
MFTADRHTTHSRWLSNERYKGAIAMTRKLIVVQDAPALTDVAIGSKGKSHGDMLAFEGAIRSEAGHSGTVRGILFTVALPGEGRPHEGRIGQLYFDLGNGDSLVVSGGTVYLGQNTEMTVNAPQVRAVIGGTGEFIGARGQVTTTRTTDGSYEHSFELV